MKYELIAIDLDDTLLTSDKTITQTCMDSIKKAVDAGITVCIVTGRSIGASARYHERLSLDTPIICVGGAQVLDKDENVIYSTGIDSDTARRVMVRASELGIHAHMYMGREFYYKNENRFSKFYAKSCGITGVEMPEILDREDLSTPKLVCCTSEEDMPRIREIFTQEFQELSFCTSHPTYLEVFKPGVNKGVALEKLCEHLGVKRENTAAIGDSEIDISMLEYAGLAGAVDNATDTVKGVADVVVPSSNHDGVAFFIDNYVLGE